MNLGINIAYCRKELNLTQGELGQKLNVTAQAISKWENSQAEPDIAMLRAMTKLFDVTIDALTGELEELKQMRAKNTQASPPTIAEGQLLGTCTNCGVVIYEENLGESSPKLVCGKCLSVSIENQKARAKAQAELNIKESKKTKKYFTIKLLVSSILPIIFLVIIIATGFNIINNVALTIVLSAYCVLALYASVYQMMTPDSFLLELFLEIAGFGIKIPGVIFSLDFEGLMFLIIAKILLWVLSWLVTLLAVAVGLLIVLIASVFSFPFALIKDIKALKHI